MGTGDQHAVDRHNFEAREKRYLEIVRQYDRKPRTVPLRAGCADADLRGWSAGVGTQRRWSARPLLGQTHIMLELGNDRAGQLFTPYSVSRMMAGISVGDGGPSIGRDASLPLASLRAVQAGWRLPVRTRC